jgi:two-component system NtrC family sensor kinase
MWNLAQVIQRISAAAPLARMRPDDTRASQRRRGVGSATSEHKVLIIDDNRAIHEDFRKTLGQRGSRVDAQCEELEALFFDDAPQRNASRCDFAIEVASQGLEGVARVEAAVAQDKRYAVAFVDVRMPPGIDGLETARRLWAVDPELEVVICSAYSDYSWEEIARELDQEGSWVILKKPFDPIEVRQLAHSLSRKWELQRKNRALLQSLQQEVERRTHDLEKTSAELAQTLQLRLQLEHQVGALKAELARLRPDES